MALHTLPHFEHHRREIIRTKRRFSGALLLLLVMLSVALGIQFRGGEAATTYTVSGRVYNATTNAGYPNVRLDLCHGQTAMTNGAGNWAVGMAFNNSFCVRYVSGVPVGVQGIFTPNNNPEHKSDLTYEYQVAGNNCYHNGGCDPSVRTWDRAADNGYDFYFTNPPAPAPTPPPPTPAPTQAPAPPPPAPTPKPVAGGGGTAAKATPRPAGGSGGGAGSGAGTVAVAPVPAPVAPTKPATPTNFQALVAGDNALVSLSWTASSSAGGVQTYRLDRSLDQKNWNTIAGNLTDSQFRDDGVRFGLHYFYRVMAVDTLGVTSDAATAEATTPEFKVNTTSGSTSYTSDDGLAVVTLAPDSLSGEANCSIATDPRQIKDKAKTVVAGPYVFYCKSSTGEIITYYKNPIAWTYNLSKKLNGFGGPDAVSVDSSGRTVAIEGAKFDTKTKILQFSVAEASPTAVLAVKKTVWFPTSLILIVILLLLAGGGLVIFKLRLSQKQNYNDYLRSKYYNL